MGETGDIMGGGGPSAPSFKGWKVLNQRCLQVFLGMLSFGAAVMELPNLFSYNRLMTPQILPLRSNKKAALSKAGAPNAW